MAIFHDIINFFPTANFNPLILCDLLPYLTHLSVLVLNTTTADDEVTEKLPSALCKMKYLKHLDISCFRFRLPTSITVLYNLQTLRIWNQEELPKRFCNLINLRHLYFKHPIFVSRCMFIGIERLTCLQTLPHFVVSRDQNCLIGQLGGLNNLRGKLRLYGLNKVAKLCEKSNIQRILLNWSNNDYKSEVGEERDYTYNIADLVFARILSFTLTTLHLGPFSEEFEEFTWPFSSSTVISFPNLTELHLLGSKKVNSILPTWQIGDCLFSAFPALTVLKILCFRGFKNLPNLTANLPSLKKLSIQYCDNLRSLPVFEDL